jgi:Fur family ferric uptake transcriptional regulator
MSQSSSNRPSPQNFEQLLREQGLRVTPQRIEIISILSSNEDHPSADDIYAILRSGGHTGSVATVYRTLSALEDAGLIRKLTFDDAPARFEIMPQSDHDHLVDIDTDELIEIPSDDMAKLREKIAAELGYEIVSQHTVLRARKLK